jgi:hypothetical protein
MQFLTANHNICSECNVDERWVACHSPHKLHLVCGQEASITFPNTGWARAENFQDLALRDNETWSYGLDISLGPNAKPDNQADNIVGRIIKALLEKVTVNEVVSDEFVYNIGMKIGMAVYSRSGPSPKEGMDGTSPLAGLNGVAIQSILGSANECVIFTGQISYVGEHDVEYDMNSFSGCSGAAIVLLESGHPECGKVLAVHSGHKPVLKTNLGMKVAKVFTMRA